MKLRITFVSLVFMAFAITVIAQENDVEKVNKTIQDFLKKYYGLNILFSSAYAYELFQGIGEVGLRIGGAC